MCSWSRPTATGEQSGHGRGQGEGLSWGSLSRASPRRPSGKEEALCRLREENQRLSREQERVSRAAQRWDRGWQGGWAEQRWAGLLGLLGPEPSFPSGPQLLEELEREQQSKQRLEGEQRETESNWEAQIADILTWWVPRGWGRGLGPGRAESPAADPVPPSQSG